MESKETVPPPPVPAGSGIGQPAKIASTFISAMSHQALAAAIGTILADLAGNPAFPHPSPTLAQVAAARNAFVAKIDAAAGGGRVATQQCRDARVPLERLMRDLALNVQQASGGDRAVLLTTGFPLQRGRQPAAVLPAPGGLRLQPTGTSGQMLVRCAAAKAAKAYQWRLATGPDPAALVPTDPTPQARYLLTGLAPGSQVRAQARMLGRAGWSDWCDAVTGIAV